MTSTAPPAISARAIEKSFKGLQVLRGVTFDVERGSIFALLGSNGAGKTTMVRILATLLRPDGGAADVNGFDVVSDALRVRESISLTGQFAAVDEILSGRRTSCWSPGCATCRTPGGSLRHCSPASTSPTPATAGSPPTRAA